MVVDEQFMAGALLVARISLAMVFLVSGLHKGIWYRKATQEFARAGIPLIGVALPATIALHVLASICIILGLYVREAALALAVFTLLASFKVHNFWRMSGDDRLAHSRIALAHLAVAGGLLMLAIAGPGDYVVAFGR